MRQAQREIDSVKKELEGDARFSQLRIGVRTNLGRDIFVGGSVPDQQSLDYLKSLMKKRISQKFRVRYRVKIPEESNESVQSSEEKTEEAMSILSEKEMRISKISATTFG